MAGRPVKTKYPGITYILVQRPSGGTEKSFYVTYRDRSTGKLRNVSVGRQVRDDMTAARAAVIRAELIEGKAKTKKDKAAEDAARPTILRLWESYKAANAHKASMRTDRYDINHLKGLFAYNCGEITTKDIAALRKQLEEAGKAPQTVRNILGLLRRIINHAVRQGNCPAPDPSRLRFDMPKVDNIKTECLTPAQLEKLFTVLDEEEDQNLAALMRLALFSGMRRGALLGLRWSDIDFEKDFITLRGEVAKSGRTEKVPLNAAARQVLQNIMPIEDSEFVFPGRDGKQRVDLRRFTNRIREKAGLPAGFRPLHGLRHTYASLLASSGEVDLYTLQKLLTHNSPQMTQRYAHLADEALHRAANVAAGILQNLSPSAPPKATKIGKNAIQAEDRPEIVMRRAK